MRLDFSPNANSAILDTTGQQLDGDADGIAGGVFNTWFRVQTPANTIFVDKIAAPNGNGSIAAPFNNIQTALAFSSAGDIVRIVGNGGSDGDITTLDDNRAYEIGTSQTGLVLSDGASLNVPRDVTVMIDSGAILKLGRARIGVGSSSVTIDRSSGALQVLGTPRVLDAAGDVRVGLDEQPIAGSVFFTSYHDDSIGAVPPGLTLPAPLNGDWGGISFRGDIDRADQNRFDYERRGIFLDSINHADIRYGGGEVVVGGVSQTIAPIHLTDSRPTISNSQISFSADAAMSANPDSFKRDQFPSTRVSEIGSLYERLHADRS